MLDLHLNLDRRSFDTRPPRRLLGGKHKGDNKTHGALESAEGPLVRPHREEIRRDAERANGRPVIAFDITRPNGDSARGVCPEGALINVRGPNGHQFDQHLHAPSRVVRGAALHLRRRERIAFLFYRRVGETHRQAVGESQSITHARLAAADRARRNFERGMRAGHP
jgi:hypothetical protein